MSAQRTPLWVGAGQMTMQSICAGDSVSFWGKRGDQDVFLTATVLTMLGGWIVAQLKDGQSTQLKRSNIVSVSRAGA